MVPWWRESDGLGNILLGNTPGLIIRIEGTLMRAIYLNVIENEIHSFVAIVFFDNSGIFQQDNMLCHTVRVVRKWFEENEENFTILSWPLNSLDLNPIEHLWDMLDQQIRSAQLPPRNL